MSKTIGHKGNNAIDVVLLLPRFCGWQIKTMQQFCLTRKRFVCIWYCIHMVPLDRYQRNKSTYLHNHFFPFFVIMSDIMVKMSPNWAQSQKTFAFFYIGCRLVLRILNENYMLRQKDDKEISVIISETRYRVKIDF